MSAPLDLDLDLDLVRHATGGRVTVRAAERWEGVTIDGRTARPGELYFAIRGAAHDGHTFAAQAVAAGATGLVVAADQTAPLPAGVTTIVVADPSLALAEVARAHRRRMPARVIGVTGSSGKTTTKELLHALLAGVVGADHVLASVGSLNNETGVPLTLLRLRPEHRFAVVEMGMRGLGHIAYLGRFAEQEIGVVVNAGTAHVGVVGSAAAIVEGKSEVFATLPPQGHAVYPADDPRLTARALALVPADRHVTFGTAAGATVRILSITPRDDRALGSNLLVEVGGATLTVAVPLVGRHNADNAACALAVAVALGLDPAASAHALASARPAAMRSQVERLADRAVLVDCYNANPDSMRAAIATLAELAAGRRTVAILGDMLELGDAEADEHAAVGAALAAAGISALITVGERARHLARGARAAGLTDVHETLDPTAAAHAALARTAPGDWLLIKASRGMRLERVLDALKEATR